MRELMAGACVFFIMPCILPQEPVLARSYLKDIRQLGDYFLKNEGDPPNATKKVLIDEKTAIGVYHIYGDDKGHIYSGGATTTESQELFFNFLTLYAILTGDETGMWGSYYYIRYYMMPHDGLESPELMDGSLVNLGASSYMPYLVHWLVNISPDAAVDKNECPSITVSQNTTYTIYDGCPYVCLDPPDENRYRFGSALDADQWVVSGLHWANSYGLGDFESDKARFKDALKNCLSKTDGDYGYDYENVMPFGEYWGATEDGNWGWRDETRKDLYSGYQDPACWYILNEPSVASHVVSFLEACQNTFNTEYGISGPFMPVYGDANPGFGWSGADENTDWAGFQYRTFAHLAHYYFLSGDQGALDILTKFYNWLKSNWTRDGDLISIPQSLYNGMEDHDEGPVGTVEESGYSPHAHALCAQALIYMAKKTESPIYKKDATTLLDDLVLNRKNGMGAYTNEDNRCYGFHNAEVGIALCLYQLMYNESQAIAPMLPLLLQDRE